MVVGLQSRRGAVKTIMGLAMQAGSVSISSGYLYRTYVTGKVYSSAGSVIETVNKYSGTKP